MIDYQDINLFLWERDNSDFTTIKVLNFYEDIGINCLYLSSDKTMLYSLFKGNKKLFDYDNVLTNLPLVLEDNLFRVNVIFFDLTFSDDITYYMINSIIKSVREKTKIPIIFYFKSRSLNVKKKSLFDTIFSMTCDYGRYSSSGSIRTSPITTNEYYIEDLKNNWKTKVSDLKTAYIRDKKLESLFDKKQDNE